MKGGNGVREANVVTLKAGETPAFLFNFEQPLARGMRRLDAALSNAPLNNCDKSGTRQSPAAFAVRRKNKTRSKCEIPHCEEDNALWMAPVSGALLVLE